MKLASIGVSMIPLTYGDRILVVERFNAIKDGRLRRVWSEICQHGIHTPSILRRSATIELLSPCM